MHADMPLRLPEDFTMRDAGFGAFGDASLCLTGRVGRWPVYDVGAKPRLPKRGATSLDPSRITGAPTSANLLNHFTKSD